MKVIQVNSCFQRGSTGKIVEGISEVLSSNGIENYIFYGTGHSKNNNSFRIGNDLYLKFNIIKTRLFGKHGFYSHTATRKMLSKIDEIKPDIIHLHNIHGHYINIKMLFEYIIKNDIKVIWTLHDCWSFTGHCAHFDYINCDKWKTKCEKCTQLNEYPISLFFDRSKQSYKEKKELFASVKNMIIVSPSMWLSGLVQQSFLKNYKVNVINNGIDLLCFKPTVSDFRKINNLEKKFLIMGIAFDLKSKKGGKYLIELSKMLGEEFAVVIVGLTQTVDFPTNVICLPKMNSKKELAEIYSAVDVFVNPTLEDTFPTVNLEALACGTPVVTFDTGGSPETIDDKTGVIAEQKNTSDLYDKIMIVKHNTKKFYEENCIKRAGLLYDEKKCFKKYVDLIKEI